MTPYEYHIMPSSVTSYMITWQPFVLPHMSRKRTPIPFGRNKVMTLSAVCI